MATSLHTTETPAVLDAADGQPINVGTTLIFTAEGTVSAIRVFLPSTVGSADTYTATLYEVTGADTVAAGGTVLGQATALGSTLIVGAWNTFTFASPVSVTTTKYYRAALRSPFGSYAYTSNVFVAQKVNGDIRGVADSTDPLALYGGGLMRNGCFQYGALSYPAVASATTDFFVDVEFTAAASGPVSATVSPATVVAAASVPTPTAGGPVHTFAFTGTSGQATGLTLGATYTARVRAVDAAGNRSALSDPVTFTTVAAAQPGTVTGAASVPTPAAGADFPTTRSPATVAAAASIPGPASGTIRTVTFTGTSGQVTGLTAGRTYTARVRARDAAGNRSGWSDPVTFTTPTVAGLSVTAGTARPVVNGGSLTLDVAAVAPAGQSITAHSWTIVSGGGTLTNATTATPTYTAPLSGPGLVVIRDTVTASGGGSASADVTVSYHATVVAAENVLAGTPRSVWDLTSPNLGGIASLQGFCDGFTANRDQTVNFKIAQSDGAGWTGSLYRLGWYGGDGARLYATLTPSGPQLAASQSQPAPGDVDPNTTLPSVDCGNWATTLTWTPPAWAPSGMYVLRLNRTGGGASHVPFVLRDDARTADVMFMPADSTWQAYNAFGGLGADLYAGNSLYYGTAVSQYHFDCARFVSYNRPVVNRGASDTGRGYGAVAYSNFFAGEYPMLRFLERNGFDAKYYGCIDAAGDPTGAKLSKVKAAMFVGHNEYWSDGMRAGWEAAKAAGTSVFSCAGNEVFWRLVGSAPDSGGRPRTWECFKSTIADRASTGRAQWTGTWRDPDGAGKGGNAPENTFTGTIFATNGPDLRALRVPADGGYAATPLWRHTSVAALTAGQEWLSPPDILGFEWDTYGPAGTNTGAGAFMANPHPEAVFCSDATYPVSGNALVDAGDVYGPGNVTHRLVVHPSGGNAITFGTGTINWAWGCDNANTYQVGNSNVAPPIQQATVNMLVDMGAEPATLMPGLTAPTLVDWFGAISTGTVTGKASIPAPTVTVVSDASRAPATVAGVAVIATPTARGGAVRSPATVTAAATVPAPAVTASSGVVASTVTATANVPAPTVVAASTVTLTTVHGVAAIATPTLHTGTVSRPDSVTAWATIPAPVVVAVRTATLTPVTVTAWAAIPRPPAVGKVPPKVGPARVYISRPPLQVRITGP